MAEVPIQVSGVLYDLTARTTQRVMLMGEASIIGLTPGGGPIIRPPSGGGSPEHPWVPPSGGPPHPEHPIPPEPEVPPGTPPNTVVKPAEPGAWGYYTDPAGAPYSAYRPAEGQAGPKSGSQ
jgi:hypothetical protein